MMTKNILVAVTLGCCLSLTTSCSLLGIETVRDAEFRYYRIENEMLQTQSELLQLHNKYTERRAIESNELAAVSAFINGWDMRETYYKNPTWDIPPRIETLRVWRDAQKKKIDLETAVKEDVLKREQQKGK